MSKPKRKAPGAALERPRGGGSYLRDPVTGGLTRVIEEALSEAEEVPEGSGGGVLDPPEPKTDPTKTGDTEQEA